MICRALLFFALFPVLAQSQTGKKYTDSLVNNVLRHFVTSQLGIENNSVDLRKYNEFKNLFELDAQVQDDYNAVYQYDSINRTGKYIIMGTAKAFDEYAHDIALQIKSLKIDSTGPLQLEPSPDNKNMVFSIWRQVTTTKERKYVLPADFINQLKQGRTITIDKKADSADAPLDALKASIIDSATYQFTTSALLYITLAIHGDSTVKISRVSSQIRNITTPDDDDGDAVLNREDSLKTDAGDFTANGRPDYDLDGVPDMVEKNAPAGIVIDKCPKTFGSADNQGCPMDYFLTDKALEGFIGLQMNSANLNLPELNKLGYVDASGADAMDVLQSKKGGIKNPGLVMGIHAGADFTYYFGQRKKRGISLGVNYSGFSADYQVTEPPMYTFKSNDSENDYRRRVTIDSLTETVKYSIINIPLMYSYRWYIGNKYLADNKKNKSVFNIKAGPSLMIFKTNSDYNANISFEGLYQSDDRGIIYDNVFDTTSSHNIFFTADKIEKQTGGRNADSVFQELRRANPNYDFANSKNYQGKAENETRLTVALNISFNLQLQFSKRTAFKAGGHFMYAPLPEKKEKYVPINKTSDPYQSIINSNSSTSYYAFGVNGGFTFNF